MNDLFEHTEVTKEELLRRIEALEAMVFRNEEAGRTAKRLQVPEQLRSAWARWDAYRATRKGWTADAKRINLASLEEHSGGNPALAEKVVARSIERGWTGLFAIKDQPSSAPRPVTGSKAALAPTESKLDREIGYLRQQAQLLDWPPAHLAGEIEKAKRRIENA